MVRVFILFLYIVGLIVGMCLGSLEILFGSVIFGLLFLMKWGSHSDVEIPNQYKMDWDKSSENDRHVEAKEPHRYWWERSFWEDLTRW